ncbi:MAG TPA: hypothetical protein VIG42_00215, partial [Solirubrobacteraceae bacterium]
GGNAARLGPLLAGPLLAGVLWEGRRALLLALAPALLYWQLATPICDYASIAGDPSVNASYYAPLLTELTHLSAGLTTPGPGGARPTPGARHAGPTPGARHAGSTPGARHAGSTPLAGDAGRRTIVEVPLTKAHWEAAYLAGHDGVELARGWERQLDTRYAALFYGRTLASRAYRTWLAENRVQYVALPDAPLDRAGALEGELIARGAPYLRELWRSEHWRLYRFMG